MQEWVEAALKPFAPKTTADIQTPEQLTEAIQVELKRKMLEYRRQLQGPLMGKSARYEHPSGVSFWVLLGDHTSSRIINSNRDDPATTFMLSKLTPGGVFLDIGANAGWFTMRAAHIYRQLGGGHVHCFEPQTALLELLNKSRVDNRLEDFITIHPVALGDQIASIFMAETSLSSGGSFVRLSGAPTSKAAQMVTLDSMDLPITRLDALKIDIEGAEPRFFMGAERFIAQHKPIIYSEVHPKKLKSVSSSSQEQYISQVKALGYDVFSIAKDATLKLFDYAELNNKSRLVNVVFQAPA